MLFVLYCKPFYDVCEPRKEISGRYFQVGTCNGKPIYRSQDVANDPEYSVSGGIFFFWWSAKTHYWYLTTVPVDDEDDNQQWSDTEIKMCANADMSMKWVPWNKEEESVLKIMQLDDYFEHVKVMLKSWQDWWCANGRNAWAPRPPSTPPPPPKTVESQHGKDPSPEWPSHLPKPPSVAAPATAASSVNPPVPVEHTEKVLNTGWKAKCCALIVAIEMQMPARISYLVTKLLGICIIYNS